MSPLPCRDSRKYSRKIRDFFVPIDFVVLDMQEERKIPLVLGRAFLNTANATINVGAVEIIFTINGQ